MSTSYEEPHHAIWWAVQIMKCLIQFGEQWKSWSASSYNLVSSANHEVLIIQFGKQCKSLSASSYDLMSIHIIKFLSYNLVSMKIMKFSSYTLVNSLNLEVLIIQFGEQCKSWSASSYNLMSMQIMKLLSYNLVSMKIMKFLSFNLVSSANHEVPHYSLLQPPVISTLITKISSLAPCSKTIAHL